jgi:hypothetical protein
MPWWAAVVAGAIAALLVRPAWRGLVAPLTGKSDPAGLIAAAHLVGGTIAILAATPFAIHPESIQRQVALQSMAALSLAGLAACAAVIFLVAARLIAGFAARATSP